MFGSCTDVRCEDAAGSTEQVHTFSEAVTSRMCIGLVDVAYKISATHGFRALGFTDYAIRCAGFKV